MLADGERVTASADENAELFWALRGGGGNFGVVTEFTFRAHPVSDVVGGPTFWPIEQTDELLATYRELLPTLPRNVGAFFCFHTIPPGPPFPEEIHLRKACGIVWCIVGSDEEAEQAIAPMLAVATPLMHGAGRVPLPGLNSAFDGLYGPGDQWYWRADFVNELPDEAMAHNAEWNSRMPSWKSGSHIYPIDGAAHDLGEDETPWAYRNTRYSQVIIGVDPDPAGAAALRDWTVGYWEALHPYSAGGAYVNFMMADEGQERVRAHLRRQLRPARSSEGDLRPGQRLPGQPEHPAGRTALTGWRMLGHGQHHGRQHGSLRGSRMARLALWPEPRLRPKITSNARHNARRKSLSEQSSTCRASVSCVGSAARRSSHADREPPIRWDQPLRARWRHVWDAKIPCARCGSSTRWRVVGFGPVGPSGGAAGATLGQCGSRASS